MLEENKENSELKWLTFFLDKQLFGVSITNVEQIVSMQPVTEVPEYPLFAKGIINLRGAIIPVIDLRVRMGKAEMQYTDHKMCIRDRLYETYKAARKEMLEYQTAKQNIDRLLSIQPPQETRRETER